MLASRARIKVEEVALSMRPAAKMDPADAAAHVNKHQVEMLEAARAHADLVRWRAFTAALEDFEEDRKSTRLNSSHVSISYAVFCLKKKNKQEYGGSAKRRGRYVRYRRGRCYYKT